ncbi:MAG: acyltransferase, partial [Actinomycetales bacterium]|nr:acyltransferase [Actinomycetales bacterium]
MAATVPEAGAHRRADIQGLRAIAVLLVVAFHAGLPVPGGFVGVDVFFVISGFVITGLLLREFAGSGRLNFRRFYSRRFRRLIPALALVVTVTALLAIPLQSPFGAQQVTAKTGIGSMLLLANAVIYQVSGAYFDGPAELNALLNTWSLSVEEQFYLLFPAVLAVGWWLSRRWFSRVGHRELGAITLVALLSGASFALSVWFTFADHPIGFIERPAQFAFYASLTRAWEFGAGALLAFAAQRWQPSQRAGLILGSAGAVLLILSVFLIDGAVPFPGWAALPPVAATLLLIAAGPTSATGRALSVGVMVWIGALSYSWYLWHWPLIV